MTVATGSGVPPESIATSIAVGTRYSLGAIPKGEPAGFTRVTHGYLESEEVGGNIQWYFVATSPGFAELDWRNERDPWSSSTRLFRIANADGSYPEQHDPVVTDDHIYVAALSRNLAGIKIDSRSISGNDYDPDGDTFSIYVSSVVDPKSQFQFTTFDQRDSIYFADAPVREVYLNGGTTKGFLADDYRGVLEINVYTRDTYLNESHSKVYVHVGSFSRQYVEGDGAANLIDMNGKTTAFDINGGAGDDRIIGGAGSDLIYGGAGNDALSGGKGDDILSGGAGADRLFGGAGNDTFVLQRDDFPPVGGAMDHIIDFEGAGVAGGDSLRITGFRSDLATVTLEHQDGKLQYYVISDGTNVGHFLLQTPDGAHLAAGDFYFA